MKSTHVAGLAVVLAMALLTLCGCAVKSPTNAMKEPSSMLPAQVSTPTSREVDIAAAAAIKRISSARGTRVPTSTRRGDPIPVYTRVREDAGVLRQGKTMTLDAASLMFLVPLDSGPRPVGQFYMSSEAPYEVLGTTDGAHADCDGFRKAASLVSAKLGPTSKVVMFKGAFDGAYGEDSQGQSALAFSAVRGVGVATNATADQEPLPSVVPYKVYSGLEARTMVLSVITASPK
jgi:hypothetical protein